MGGYRNICLFLGIVVYYKWVLKIPIKHFKNFTLENCRKLEAFTFDICIHYIIGFFISSRERKNYL